MCFYWYWLCTTYCKTRSKCSFHWLCGHYCKTSSSISFCMRKYLLTVHENFIGGGKILWHYGYRRLNKSRIKRATNRGHRIFYTALYPFQRKGYFLFFIEPVK